MKVRHIILLLLLLNIKTGIAQSYKEIQNEADQKYQAKEYKAAAQLNEKAFELADEKDKAENLYFAAQCWALDGDKSKAFECLERAIDYGWSDIERTKKTQCFETLKSENQWGVLMQKFTKIYEQKNTTYYWGMFLGILFILFFYNLFLFFSLKDAAFLFFSFAIFFISQIEITRTPEFRTYAANIFVWSKYIHMRTPDLICLFMVFHLLFVKSFLNLKTTAPRLNKTSKVLTIFFIFYFLILLFSQDSVFAGRFVILPLFLLGYLFTFIAGIICWKSGYRPARFFVIANIASALGFFITAVNFMRIIDIEFQISVFHADNLGTIAFCGLMSFALGDKINIHKKEKEEAQEKALEVLEEKVYERTIEVVKQKEIIENKNKDITDSINYAKRIQQAKLPRKDDIYTSFPQSFVLFKPKDIVSGDFYFFHKSNQSVFIAAADCTGHGVPGSLMSMIGTEKLEDAVSENIDPSIILNLLNKGIKTSLRQSDSNESTRDGMDIALCSVDTENRIIKYAGANRPLWIIRNGQTELEEIKATKTAIGGLTEDAQIFDTHELKLFHGDTFYICTDGYADQFSGRNEKKLMTKKFKEILLSIQDQSMKEQEQYLDNFIENWKAGTEQVDDILVIGIRL